jgi:uncharacterized membrane protein YfcA
MIGILDTVLAYIGLGIVAGLLSGLLGVGGGLLVVPGLAFLFLYHHIVADNLVMRLAAASSLAAMMVTTGFALKAHASHGVKFWSIFRLLLPGIIIGAIAGTLIASTIPGATLRVLFGLFVLVVAIRTFLPEKSHPTRQLPGKWGNSLVGFLMGAISGTLGIGGSTLVIPYLIYYNIPMRNAIAVSAACGSMIALVASCAYIVTGWHVTNLPKWSTGYVYWPAVIGVGIASPWFATLGAALSHRLSTFVLRRVFAVFLLFIAIDMLIR